MKGFIWLFLVAFFANDLKAQNLVRNPGFELFYDCPSRIGEFAKTKFWFSGNSGSPELYHQDCKDYFFERFDEGYEGQGHAGLIFHCQYKNAVEYIGTELKDSLIKGRYYCLGFKTKAKASPFYIENIGAILRDKDPCINQWAAIRTRFDLKNNDGFITPDEDWVEVSGKYLASGGERYLLIGNFATPDQTNVIADKNGMSASPGWMSYYYIDNVFVFELPDSSSRCESILADDTHDVLRSEAPFSAVLYFDFNSSNLLSREIPKLKKLKDLSISRTDTIILSGHTDARGSNAYNLKLSSNRVKSVQNFIQDSLGLEAEIKLSFEGEVSPISDNRTDKGRAQNRRVELILKR